MNSRSTVLGEIADIITGPFGSQLHKHDYVPIGTPSIMPQNIGNRILDKTSIARISDADTRRLSRYAVVENDIVYARRGDVEKHAFITIEDSGAICGTGCMRVRVNELLADPMFISFYLNRPETKKWISQHAVGSSMPNINSAILNAMPLELPSIQVQRRIASILNVIDSRISINARILPDLDATAKTLYDYWFVQFDFPNTEGKPYRTSGGEMMWSEKLKIEIPKQWTVECLNSIVEINTQGFDPSQYNTQMIEHYSIPAFDNGCYPVFEEAYKIESGKYLVPTNSILFSKLNPQYKRIWDPYCISEIAVCSTEFMVYMCKNSFDRPFIYALLDSDKFFKFSVSIASSSTGSRMRLTPQNTLDYLLAVPDRKILDEFYKSISPILDRIKLLRIENHELSQLRDWLLPMLMNGQVTVQ